MGKLPLSVLLVEDDISNRLFVSEIINDEFETIYTACDGVEGLMLYTQYQPDIVISDIQMPKMNGLDMIERIKIKPTNTRFIIISAYDISDFFIRAINIGVDNFIMKPIDLDKLMDTVQKVAKTILTEKELKQKTSELASSEQRFRKIAEDLPSSWLGIFDENLRLTFLRGQEIRQNKIEAGELIGKPLEEAFELLGIEKAVKRDFLLQELKNYEINIDNSTYLLNSSYLNNSENSPQKQILFVAHDISEIKKAEIEIRLSEARLSSLLKISQLRTNSIQELFEFALDEAISLTDSEIGYIFNYNEASQELELNCWSKNVMEQCTIFYSQNIFHINEVGIWAEPVRQGKPIIINDFRLQHHLKKGYPEEHIPIKSFLSIPVFHNDMIVGVVGVANKRSGYLPADMLQLTLLMNFVWKISEQRNAEQALKESEKKLMNAVIQAEEKERMRFAQDLHDGLGPILSTTKLYIQTLADTHSAELKKEIVEKARKTVDEALAGLTEISNNLSPHILHNFGLVSAIKSFIDKLKSNVEINFKLNYNLTKRPKEIIEITLYRIVVELINNSIKHAKANGVGISIQEDEYEIKLTYIDNGKGFDVEKQQATNKGMGLFNIRKRIANLNGKLRLESSEGKGIWVEIVLNTYE